MVENFYLHFYSKIPIRQCKFWNAHKYQYTVTVPNAVVANCTDIVFLANLY